ncbi:MAG: hypothetical protein R3F35_00545 [Myxococcota bacterium]
MTPGSPQTDRTSSAALALQRVLALEGRNALSRVALAASEVSRFGLVPGALERITAIRDAVDELDSLLDKIERLAAPARTVRSGSGSSIAAAWGAVRARIEPVLAVRDLRLELVAPAADPLVGLPTSVAERLLLLWVRTVVAAVERERSGASEPVPISLRLTVGDAPVDRSETHEVLGGEPGGVELALRAFRHDEGLWPCLERAERVELEVALAEWQGGLADTDDGHGAGWCIRLPGAARDAA